MVQGRHGLLVSFASLNRKRPLPGLRNDVGNFEAKTNLMLESEPLKTTSRENQCVEATLSTLAQTRVYVPTQRFNNQTGLKSKKQRTSPCRSRADSHAGFQTFSATQGVPRVATSNVSPNSGTWRV